MASELRTTILVLLLLFFLSTAASADKALLNLGDWSETKIERMLEPVAVEEAAGQRISQISEKFLGTPYRSSTLIGSVDESEQLVIRLDGVDCFTFLDTVEALRRAHSFEDFRSQLQQVRYRDGNIDYLSRHHFFSDWAHSNTSFLQDVTQQIGVDAVLTVDKVLNQKADGGFYLKGYPPVSRTIHYLPVDKIDTRLLAKMRTGDYLGFYTAIAGLDVTHVGILIKREGQTYLRHASSASQFRKVVDSELRNYLKGKTGLIVLRPQ